MDLRVCGNGLVRGSWANDKRTTARYKKAKAGQRIQPVRRTLRMPGSRTQSYLRMRRMQSRVHERSRPLGHDLGALALVSGVRGNAFLVMKYFPPGELVSEFARIEQVRRIHRRNAGRWVVHVDGGDDAPAGPRASADGRKKRAFQGVEVAHQVVRSGFDFDLTLLEIRDPGLDRKPQGAHPFGQDLDRNNRAVDRSHLPPSLG